MPKFAFTPALATQDVSQHGMTLSAKADARITHVNHPLTEGFDLSAFAGLDCHRIAPGQFYVVGEATLPELNLVTLTDQSNGTALIELKGGNYLAVLSSLTGADLSDTRFNAGSAIQTRLGHVSCNLKRDGNAVSIIAPRSFAEAIWSDITEAMTIFG
jgi:heterotetrameric sarcosine oxidase gamma subunit